ncbi:MAG: AmpG family muropeptide MFS transporter [Rhodoferax sp.]|uniref:AmpG family muropeptide MFS transporter n=1 Tax=Rhodoferax sp. TaxID=50421 RepID=UPI00262CEFD1|nr:AmpG family muropeptide MFS transporter [Rhodoferax sp.]MDD5335200.1 AmpG family muropeptide MFS transporter [Rhodoferax sp.]
MRPTNVQSEAVPRSLWWWVPSLYFGQGIPYVVVMTLSVIMYKKMGISNTDIALYTSWLYLPWVIKPLWSPFVEMFRTKRFWIVSLQLLIGASLAGVALTIPLPQFFQITLAVFWLMAFSSATHDIAADGFYMLALKEHEQAAFVGVRSTFYRISMIAGQGGLVFVAGRVEQATGNVPFAWSIVFIILAAMFVSLSIYHKFVLPKPDSDAAGPAATAPVREFFAVFATFLRKKEILAILAFLLLYRFGEAQLLKLAAPFLLDSAEKGGLALSTQQVGVVYGTIGILCLTVGGLLGGYVISLHGLKRWLWPMVLSVNVPHLVYVYLSHALPTNIWQIGAAVALEQLGYGFGFAAYLLYMIMVSDGPHKTAHYAICTGFMALGMMLPGMVSGWVQTQLGYANFFIWVCFAAVPAFIATAAIRVDKDFGKKVQRS